VIHAGVASHQERYRQIAGVLARYGLGYLLGVLGLERFEPLSHGLLGHPRRTEPYTQAEHLRMALEELGAAFIKLGQLLSTRADLLPPDYLAELAKLQDAVPPVPADAVRTALIAELGRPIEDTFATFDPEPLAAGSIGQVQTATLPPGTEVVVKVRRPGVVEQVGEDLDILQNLAATASRRWERAKEYDVVGLAQEFAATLRAELDYLSEGRHAERFATSFAGDSSLHVPCVYWDTTTSRVLTLERIRGIKINNLDALEAAGIDRTALAGRAARIVLKMVFEDGFFHADLHPGNVLIEPDGRIALIDFGMVGTVDERTRDHLVRVLLAVTSQDADRLVDAFADLGVAAQVDRARLRRDLGQLLARYGGRPLGEIALGPVLDETLTIVRRHHLQMPANLVLLFKTLVMTEGMGAQLDPSFHLTGVLAPYAQRLLLRQYSPLQWARRVGPIGLEAAQLGMELPEQLRRIIAALEHGTLEIGARPVGIEPLVQRLERLAHRIVVGVITAAFIVGLAILMAVDHPLGWPQLAGVVFVLGIVIAAGLGASLAWGILRSGRR
jgi:ubiquinone biosynthesis protein